MAIKVTLEKPDKLVVTIKDTKTIDETVKLKARKSLSGDIMIFDHHEIDIVILTEKKKILTFAKEHFSDQVYEAQNRLFTFLRKRGVIEYDTIAGGSIFYSMEALIQESKEYNEVQHALLAVARFIDKERPLMAFEKAFEEFEEKRLDSPPPGEYTDLDLERNHEERKGSINPGHFPYGLQTAAVYRLEE